MGETTSPNFPVTANAVDPSFNGVSDIFITKMNTTIAGPLSLSYLTYLGGSGEERVGYSGGIAVAPAAIYSKRRLWRVSVFCSAKRLVGCPRQLATPRSRMDTTPAHREVQEKQEASAGTLLAQV